MNPIQLQQPATVDAEADKNTIAASNTITGMLTVADHLAAQRLHMKTPMRNVRTVLLMAGLLGLALCLTPARSSGVTLFALSAGLLLVTWLFDRFGLPRNVARLHAQQKDFAHPFVYRWDDEFLEGIGMSGQSRRRWADYSKAKEDEHCFLLYQSDNLFEMLPKSWFCNSSQIQDIRTQTAKITK
jgi:hypothetical protein